MRYRLVAWLARLIAGTWRLEVVGEGRLSLLKRDGVPVLYAVWHGALLAPLWQRRRRGITLLVGAHRDAEYLARAARGWGYRLVRGSSTRSGVSGLRRLVRALSGGGAAAVAPDGPRGPARVAKPGVVAAAQWAGAAIVPVAAAARPAWRLGSWDRFTVPMPFARVRVVFGEPLRIEGGRTERLRGQARLEHALDAVEDAAAR